LALFKPFVAALLRLPEVVPPGLRPLIHSILGFQILDTRALTG
jgi:hypothetical protein